MELGETLTLIFSASFDSMSRKFIDRAREAAGASNKVRLMFRNVYSAASAYTTTPSTDGGRVKSDNFRIRRGVLQGDVTSPIYFILALEMFSGYMTYAQTGFHLKKSWYIPWDTPATNHANHNGVW